MPYRTVSIFLLAILTFAGGCERTDSRRCAAMRPAAINHVVFIERHEPDDVDALICDCDCDCDAMLATIPSVHVYSCGRHLDTGRDTIRSDYDACLGFQSESDLNAYVAHPQHIELVNKWRPRIKVLRA